MRKPRTQVPYNGFAGAEVLPDDAFNRIKPVRPFSEPVPIIQQPSIDSAMVGWQPHRDQEGNA